MKLAYLLLLVIISACSGLHGGPPDGEQVQQNQLSLVEYHDPLTEFASLNIDETNFGVRSGVNLLDDIFSLSAPQQIDFWQYYNHLEQASLLPNERITRYLQSSLDNFNFHSDTLVAQQSLSKISGNCLSLAILTAALADLAKVKISYELVSSEPVYQQKDGLVVSSQHIRTLLYNPEQENLDPISHLFIPGYLRVDYLPSRGTRTLRKVSEPEFFAMYYQNKAAEALVIKDYSVAYWNLKQALLLTPRSAHAINMLGIIHKRIGKEEQAEKIFLYGLKHSEEKFELLSNYQILLHSAKRFAEAQVIANQLAEYYDPNPFKWINQADRAYRSGDFSKALELYRKAASMAEYLHEPYFGIARTQYQLGNLPSAKIALQQVLENTHKKEEKTLYQAKYQMLSQLMNKSN